ncbi:MAG: hypothetical protein ACD_76C00063G0001, partial [uncultured bacterium]
MDKQSAVTVKPKKVSLRSGTSTKPTKASAGIAVTMAKKSVACRERAKAARQSGVGKTPCTRSNALTASGLYYATELERVMIIRQGVPASILVQIGRA